MALLGATWDTTQAVRIHAGFSDDLMKQLAEDMQKDSEGGEEAQQE